MTNTTVLIPDELLPPVQKYTSIKKEFHEAMEAAQEMKKLATQAPSESSYDPITSLTPDGSPPAELFAAQRELQQSLKQVAEAQQAIELKEQAIEKIQSSARMYMIIIAVIAVIAVIALIAIIFGG